jgi:SAM-dependent methyltransferase
MTKEEHWQYLKQDPQFIPGYWVDRLPIPYRMRRLRHILRAVFANLTEQGDFLKLVQDVYVLHRFAREQGKKILEVGGGYSRVARRLSRRNEYWLVDKYEDRGNRPPITWPIGKVRFIIDHMGRFNPALPDGYFDLVFSISVVEHIPLDRLDDFFRDCARVLKPGGRLLHAIDSYAFDEQDQQTAQALAWAERSRKYLSFADRPDLGVRLLEPPSVGEEPRFYCRYASLPDEYMHRAQGSGPDLKRVIGQRVSLIAEWIKAA